jgi:hypothetical protein
MYRFEVVKLEALSSSEILVQSTRLHGVINQKATTGIFTAVQKAV